MTIKEAIITAVAFFDLFEYPLTEKEIWQYLPQKAKLGDIQEALRDLRNDYIVVARGGFYYLVKQDKNIAKRRRRYYQSDRKIKKAKRIAALFKFIPWIEMIAVGNIMGVNNLKNESDIDLFIIAEPRRIWITRFVCVVLTKSLGLRPSPGKQKDKICLSFYIASDSLNLVSYLLEGITDYYFLYWLANLVVLYDRKYVYEKLIRENSWLQERLPNWQSSISSRRRKISPFKQNWYRDIVDMLFGGLDESLGIWQKKKFPASIKDSLNKNTNVVASDKVLKLHVKDRRRIYYDQLREKLKNINV